MKLLNLKIDKIVTNSNQPRKYFDNGKMSELKDSIKNSGLLQPITVRKISNGKYEIVAGESRYRACRELGMVTPEDMSFLSLKIFSVKILIR